MVATLCHPVLCPVTDSHNCSKTLCCSISIDFLRGIGCFPHNGTHCLMLCPSDCSHAHRDYSSRCLLFNFMRQCCGLCYTSWVFSPLRCRRQRLWALVDPYGSSGSIFSTETTFTLIQNIYTIKNLERKLKKN
uniref:Uncharacterized protein n=1 Tax=Lutzomyia longipalpis TaxID=7200 RepID=A0A1B0CS78_LUTLO